LNYFFGCLGCENGCNLEEKISSFAQIVSELLKTQKGGHQAPPPHALAVTQTILDRDVSQHPWQLDYFEDEVYYVRHCRLCRPSACEPDPGGRPEKT
jgi:hypothetical protein